MKIAIAARPASAYATISLDAGEEITCECGAMIAMTPGTTVETTSRSRGGGMMRGLKRMFSKEGFFLNHFTARSPAQQLVLAPTLPGDILHLQVQGTIVAQGGSWLASGTGAAVVFRRSISEPTTLRGWLTPLMPVRKAVTRSVRG